MFQKADNLTPGDPGEFLLRFLRYPTGSFPENLEMMDNPDLDKFVPLKRFFSGYGVFLNLFYGFHHVQEQKAGRLS